MSGLTHTQQIKMLLTGLAEYYGINLSPTRIAMYAEDLEDLSIEKIGAAMKSIRRNPAHKFFPLPSIIREEILGNQRDEALEAANRILQAISKFGWYNAERSKEFIGELGWRVIEREGGWQTVCQRTTNHEIPTLKAQWRELAIATQKRIARGDDSAPKLTGLTSVARLLLPENMKDKNK